MKKPELKKERNSQQSCRRCIFQKEKNFFLIHCMFFSFALSFLRFYLDFMKELHSSSEFCFNDETPGKISGVFSDLFLGAFGILLLN